MITPNRLTALGDIKNPKVAWLRLSSLTSSTIFMFARPSSSAYVCLRCHLRLARQILPHRTSILAQQRIHLSISCSRPFSSSLPAQWVDPSGPKDDNGEGESRARRRDKHYHPLGKLRGKKGGQQVRENAEALSVNSLGKPAEVIVLRDAPRHDFIAEEGYAEENDGPAKGSSSEALLNSIEGDDVVMDQDTVNQQIDALRPRVEDPNSGRLILPAKEYSRLCKVLTSSYSRSQLDAYMAHSKHVVPEQTSLEDTQKLPGPKNSDIQVRPWKPASKLDMIVQKHLGKQLGPKDKNNLRKLKRSKLASTLLRECWKVEVAEEVERLGETICTLPQSGIRLLTAGSKWLHIAITVWSFANDLSRALVLG